MRALLFLKKYVYRVAMKIQIKPSDDVDSAILIARHNPHYFNKAGIKKMKSDLSTNIFFGAFVNEDMAGFINYKIINAKVVEIIWMAIEPKYQNQGIGTRLITETLKRFLNKYKICQVKTLSEIDPDQQYARARAFYIKMKFISLDSNLLHPDWGKDNPCQIFIKLL